MLPECVKELYNLLDTYKYFVIGHDCQPHGAKNSLDWDKWNIVASPQLFHSLKGGSCWDYCIATSDFLTKNKIPHWNYALICAKTPFEKENHCTPTTHTFTILYDKESDQYYYIEQSFKAKKGIYGGYYSLNDALYDTFRFLCEENPNQVETLELHKHEPLNPNTYGMDSHQYLRYMQNEPTIWVKGEPVELLLTAKLD